MDRSCLLCIGDKSILERIIQLREDSKKRDYMKYVFCIPVSKYVEQSAIDISGIEEIKNILPENEILHTGYCGEECRKLLLTYNLQDKWVICGIEFPGCGYLNYDIVFPQGRSEKGETSRETAIREFIEETGIFIEPRSSEIKFLGFVVYKKELSVYMYELNKIPNKIEK